MVLPLLVVGMLSLRRRSQPVLSWDMAQPAPSARLASASGRRTCPDQMNNCCSDVYSKTGKIAHKSEGSGRRAYSSTSSIVHSAALSARHMQRVDGSTIPALALAAADGEPGGERVPIDVGSIDGRSPSRAR